MVPGILNESSDIFVFLSFVVFDFDWFWNATRCRWWMWTTRDGACVLANWKSVTLIWSCIRKVKFQCIGHCGRCDAMDSTLICSASSAADAVRPVPAFMPFTAEGPKSFSITSRYFISFQWNKSFWVFFYWLNVSISPIRYRDSINHEDLIPIRNSRCEVRVSTESNNSFDFLKMLVAIFQKLVKMNRKKNN